MNGANSHGAGYKPDVNSYDYVAPLDESGRPRPKYFRMREIIANATGETPPAVPESPALITIPAIQLKQSQSLWNTLPAPVRSDTTLSMEDLNQAYGYILYRTKVDGRGSGDLVFDQLHSYARVYVDGKLQGVADRRLDQNSVAITVEGTRQLDILVENSGRVNFSTVIRGERAGILGSVSFGGKAIIGWKNYPLPFATPPVKGFRNAACSGPCLYRAEFTVQKPGDTFLNTEKLGKGVVWVNGHLLGRFWNIGPMGDLYLPAVWLHVGKNEIAVLDLNGGAGLSIEGQDHQTYMQPKAESQSPSTEVVHR
jgi:beta-galactosidase